MPFVYIPKEELKALFSIFTVTAKIDWAAYDQAKKTIINAAKREISARELRELNEIN